MANHHLIGSRFISWVQPVHVTYLYLLLILKIYLQLLQGWDKRITRLSHICYRVYHKKDSLNQWRFCTIMQNRDWCKKWNWPKNWLLTKNPYFLSDQTDSLVILPTHELSTLTKFHCNRAEIENFLAMG